jgi:hypothetical protein
MLTRLSYLLLYPLHRNFFKKNISPQRRESMTALHDDTPPRLPLAFLSSTARQPHPTLLYDPRHAPIHLAYAEGEGGEAYACTPIQAPVGRKGRPARTLDRCSRRRLTRACWQRYVSSVLGVSDLCFNCFIWMLQK